MHGPSLGGGEAGALGWWVGMRMCDARVYVRTRAGGLLRAIENLQGALVAVLGTDVLAGTPDPPRGG